MTVLGVGTLNGSGANPVDLRRAPLGDLRAVDLRAPGRDLWADELAMWDRLEASWAGLDDAAWHLPGAAPSDAGGPDWSLAEHVGHIVDWQELAVEYTARAIETGQWPADDDFLGGDFDRFNESRREPWASMGRDTLLARFRAARPRLVALAKQLTPETMRGDAAWGWLYMTLHGHYLDHLPVIEPWAAALRRRQTDGDPFVADPRTADHAEFIGRDGAIEADLDRLLRQVPTDRWTEAELTPGWNLRDHVGHLADWLDQGLRAVEAYRRTGGWPTDPEEGIDAWNERMVENSRSASPADAMARYATARAELLAEVGRLSVEELRSDDGWSWTYDCLYGHVRKHLAMIAPWCARADWPAVGR